MKRTVKTISAAAVTLTLLASATPALAATTALSEIGAHAAHAPLLRPNLAQLGNLASDLRVDAQKLRGLQDWNTRQQVVTSALNTIDSAKNSFRGSASSALLQAYLYIQQHGRDGFYTTAAARIDKVAKAFSDIASGAISADAAGPKF